MIFVMETDFMSFNTDQANIHCYQLMTQYSYNVSRQTRTIHVVHTVQLQCFQTNEDHPCRTYSTATMYLDKRGPSMSYIQYSYNLSRQTRTVHVVHKCCNYLNITIMTEAYNLLYNRTCISNVIVFILIMSCQTRQDKYFIRVSPLILYNNYIHTYTNIKELQATLKRPMRDIVYVQSTIHRYKIHFILNKISWQILAEIKTYDFIRKTNTNFSSSDNCITLLL